MIDTVFPAVGVDLMTALGPAAAAHRPRSTAEVVHEVVSAALANRDYAVAEQVAQVARQLLPDDDAAASDLAQARAMRGNTGRQVQEVPEDDQGKRVMSMGDIGRKRRRIEVLPEQEPAEAPARAPERTPAPEQPAKTPAPAAP